MSKKTQKAANFIKQMRENETKFRKSGLPRPQEAFNTLKFRLREINSGNLVLTHPQTTESTVIQTPWYMKNSRKLFSKLGPQWDVNFGNLKPKWILNASDFMEFYKNLTRCSEFSLDVEGHTYDTRVGFLPIIQIGTWSFGDYIIGAYEVRDEIIKYLKPVLEDHEVLKITHGGINDHLWLQRDFGIFLQQNLDVQIMEITMNGGNPAGLKNLSLKYFPHLKDLVKEETLSEWRLRPGKGLTQNQSIYAAFDVHVVLRLADLLKFQLNNVYDEVHGDKLEKAFYVSNENIRHKLYRPPAQTPEVRHISTRLDLTNAEALREWRTTVGKWMDKPDEKVISNYQIERLSKLQTVTLEDINAVTGDLGKILNGQKSTILKIIEASNKTAVINSLKDIVCHKCDQNGHPAWACHLPRKPPGLWKKQMQENEITGRKQYERRMRNWEQNRELRRMEKEEFLNHPCKFFLQGKCVKGADCRFQH